MVEGISEDMVATEPLALGDRVLDRYRVVQRITAGGHSVVYRGEDERLSRPVCIKVFYNVRTGTGAWRTSYEHFVQEAFALSRLTHPNTLRIYDFGHLNEDEDEGAPFQVSEFMNGGTLWHLVREEGPLPVAEVVRVVSSLCGALAEAHACGIVHRDIKPKNILFGTAGPNRVPKLADFGIAKSLPMADGSLRNRAGDTQIVAGHRLVMYSPNWAAPEQLIGSVVTPATDLYSLAVVTVFMLTGKLVFQARELEAAYQQRHEQPGELLAEALEGAEVPPQALEVFERACCFEPQHRFASAAEFLAAFEEAILGGGGAEELPPPPEPPAPALVTDILPGGRAGAATVPPRRLRPSAQWVAVADRRSSFVPIAGGSAVVSGGNARLRLTFLPGPGGALSIHVKGLNCFVARDGRPPSGAVNVTASEALHLVAPNRQPIGRAELCFGNPAAGHTLFTVGTETVAIGSDDCPSVFAIDFGPGADCLFLYTPAVIADEGAPRRSRRRRSPA